MKRTSRKSWFRSQKNIIAVVIIVVLVLGGTAFAAQKVRDYNDAANQADMVGIRELILLSLRGVKKDAPVDARTGDVYFPEARLYLPNPGIPLALTYLFDTGDIADAQSGLSVSTYPVRSTQALYTARNTKELFAAVPKLQACSRGIKLVYGKFPSSDTQNVLRHTLRLNNGKILYVYLERDCPELGATADLFVNVKAY